MNNKKEYVYGFVDIDGRHAEIKLDKELTEIELKVKINNYNIQRLDKRWYKFQRDGLLFKGGK